jgi:nucleoid-associated protein YgaU
MMSASSILPKEYQKNPANLLVAMEAAEALGVTLFQAIQMVTVINGRMTMSAEGMRALVLSQGHLFRIEEESNTVCRVAVARRERPDEVQRFTFTAEDAQRAGLTGGNYGKYPAAMLLARATTKACRALFPDVIAGISYAPEEAAEFAPVTVVAAQQIDMAPRPASAEQRTGIRDLLDRLVEALVESGAMPSDPVSRADVVRHIVGRDDATIRNLTFHEARELIRDLTEDVEGTVDAVIVEEGGHDAVER